MYGDSETRAHNLLISHLNRLQKQQFRRNGWFEVMGEYSHQVYRLEGETLYLIGENDQPIISYCVHLPTTYPEADSALAIKLALETDERGLLDIANGDPYDYAEWAEAYECEACGQVVDPDFEYAAIGWNWADPTLEEDDILQWISPELLKDED